MGEFQRALEELRSKKEEEYLEAERALENAAEFHRVALLTSSAKLDTEQTNQKLDAKPSRKMADLLAIYKTNKALAYNNLSKDQATNLLVTMKLAVKKCVHECRTAILGIFAEAESLDEEIENLCLPRCKWRSSYVRLRDDKCCDQAFFPWLEEQLEIGK